jgi:hypothetical protein
MNFITELYIKDVDIKDVERRWQMKEFFYTGFFYGFSSVTWCGFEE